MSLFFRWAVAFPCVWMLAACSTSEADRPNVLFITVDDMNADSVGVFGSEVPATTPNIDRLASQGLRFEHGHTTIAVCQPARAVWMTGRYPHRSGVTGFQEIRPGVPTLPEILHTHGYITGILGKTHHVIPSRRSAFDYLRTGKELLGGRSAERYARFSREFLERARRSAAPFFLMVNAHDPHRPFDDRRPAGERETTAVGKGDREFDGGHYPAPSRIYQPAEIAVPSFVPDLPGIREEIAQYFSSVRRADDVVGAVLRTLDESGFAQSTLVMFQSDNGMALPFAKTNVWRDSTRTPWIVRWPGVVPPGARDSEHLLGGVDFAPTVLDALGIELPDGMDGRSFLPLLKGEKQSGRDYVYTYFYVTFDRHFYPMRAIQNARYGYIWNGWSDGHTVFQNRAQGGLTMKAMLEAAKQSPAIAARVRHFLYRTPEEFYDYAEDPHALHCLIDDPAMQDRIAAFRVRLRDHMNATGDPELKRFEKAMGP